MMSHVADAFLKYTPIALLVAGLVGTGYVTLERQAALAEEVEDISESVDENEDNINAMERLLLRQQGDQKLEIQELKGDIKLILRLLQEAERQ